MNHEDYQELLAASALTALDDADARVLNSHLQNCAECRAELSQWENTASALALEATPMEPSPEVRERILASVRADRSQSSQVVPFVPPARTWSSFSSFGAIAAALIFALMLFATGWMMAQRRQDRLELAELRAELLQTQQELDHKRDVLALLSSPDTHMMKLDGTKMAPSAYAMLAYDKNGHAMLMARGLPAAPAGMAYQLWFIKDNQKMPGKVFNTDPAGNGMLEDQIPDVARQSAVFAITLEPAQGVASPTGQIYLVSS
jgi:anti-sigma-K factor RskA